MGTLTLLKPRDINDLAKEYVRKNVLTECTDLTDSLIHYHAVFKAKYWDIARPLYDDDGRSFNHSFLVKAAMFHALRQHGEFVMCFEGQYFWFRDQEKLETPLAADKIVQAIALS